MKKFLLRLLSFLIITSILNFFLNKIFPVPGDSRYNSRISYLQERISNYNTLFFGSSRTLRHIVPSVFDSSNSSKGIFTHSFNLGTPANKSLESYEQYERFLENYSKSKKRNLKYTFLEIHPLNEVLRKNMTTRKGYYWVDWKNLNFIYYYFKVTSSSIRSRIEIYSTYFFAYLINSFGFNYLNIEDAEQDRTLFNGINKDGYISLKNEIKLTKNNERKQELLLLIKTFKEDTSDLSRRRLRASLQFKKQNELNNVVLVHITKLKKLLQQSAKLNIKLIFIIQPRLTNYQEMLALKNTLPETSIFEIADPEIYPEFWSIENAFDVGHMTEKGALIFTKVLSDKFCFQEVKLDTAVMLTN